MLDAAKAARNILFELASHRRRSCITLNYVPIKRHGVDGVLVAVDDVDALPLGNVPHNDEVVVAGREEDVLGRRMPLEVHDATPATNARFETNWTYVCASSSLEFRKWRAGKLHCSCIDYLALPMQCHVLIVVDVAIITMVKEDRQTRSRACGRQVIRSSLSACALLLGRSGYLGRSWE